MNEKTWFYADDMSKHGPFTVETLRELIDVGRLSRNMLIWKEGMQDWVAAKNLPQFENRFSDRSIPPPLRRMSDEVIEKVRSESNSNSSTSPVQNKASFTKLSIASFAVGIGSAVVSNALVSPSGGLAFAFGHALGFALILIFLCYLFAWIPVGIYWLFKRKRMPGLATAIWIIWSIVAMLSIAGSFSVY